MTSTVGAGFPSDGRSLVLAAPKGVVADRKNPTKAELSDPRVLDITYLLFADGFDHQTETSKFTTGRYTLAQILENEGTVKDSITLKYPYVGTDADVLRTKLAQHSEWDIFERLVTSNEVELQDGQLLSIAAPVRCGLQREIPRAANTEIGKIQDLLVTGKVERDVKIGGAGSLGWAVEITGGPTGGSFVLTVNGYPTAPIAFDANAAAVAAAVNGLSGLTGATATGSGTSPKTLTFTKKVTVTADGSGLTGGTAADVTVAAV